VLRHSPSTNERLSRSLHLFWWEDKVPWGGFTRAPNKYHLQYRHFTHNAPPSSVCVACGLWWPWLIPFPGSGKRAPGGVFAFPFGFGFCFCWLRFLLDRGKLIQASVECGPRRLAALVNIKSKGVMDQWAYVQGQSHPKVELHPQYPALLGAREHSEPCKAALGPIIQTCTSSK
jgi:hypothetical protein